MKRTLLITTAAVIAVGGSASAQDGHLVFLRDCAVCHGSYSSLNPVIGDKAGWAPFIKQGTKALVAAVISGTSSMPPRGGHPYLTDTEIKAAVEYIVSRSR